MNKILKHAVLLVLLPLVVFPAFSSDVGVELTNKAGVREFNTDGWFSDHKATLWTTIPLTKSNSSSLAIEAGLYASKPVFSEDFTWYANLDLFRLSVSAVKKEGLSLSFDAGRFSTNDITGMVLSQRVDGIELHISVPFANIDILAGYTGLLNARMGETLMSADDIADAAEDDIYTFGAKRAVGKVTMQFPQMIGQFDLILEGSGQYDVRRMIESDATNLIDTAYGTLSLGGPVTNMLFFTVNGTFQTGINEIDGSKSSEHSLLASGRFDLFPSPGNQLFVNCLYIPAGGDFFNDTFKGISAQTAGSLYGGVYGNLVEASAGWYISPSRALNLDIGAKAFIKVEPADGEENYTGTEISGGASYTMTSDFRLRLDSSIWLPNDDDMVMELKLTAVFNF